MTPTETPTNTPTNTETPTNTPSNTETPTNTPSNTVTPTNTPSNTVTPTETPTNTPTNTETPTNTPSNTETPMNTPTNTETPTNTPTNTETPTNTPTNTETPTETPTSSVTPSVTVTPSTTLSSIDPDAQAFLTAASITDITITNAINDLVLGLKSNNLWVKMQGIWPFVGGTSLSNSINLKQPGTFDYSWSGGVTHNSNGVTFNGVNGYGVALYIPQVQAIQNDTHMSIYSRTNNAKAIGDFNSSNFEQSNRMNMILKWVDNNSYHDFYSPGINRMIRSATDSLGLFTISRTTSTDFRLFIRDTQQGATITAVTGNVSSINGYLYIGSQFRGNTFINGQSSDRNYAFSTIGRGLTTIEVGNFNTLVQTFQTTLGRQV